MLFPSQTGCCTRRITGLKTKREETHAHINQEIYIWGSENDRTVWPRLRQNRLLNAAASRQKGISAEHEEALEILVLEVRTGLDWSHITKTSYNNATTSSRNRLIAEGRKRPSPMGRRPSTWGHPRCSSRATCGQSPDSCRRPTRPSPRLRRHA